MERAKGKGMKEEQFDAVVIGAGAGGLFAAAHLVNQGRTVLVVDEQVRVGGRATSFQIDGFTVNTGAIALKLGGPMEELLKATDVPYDVRVPEPRTCFRVDGKIVHSGKGGLGLILAGLTKSAAKIGAKFVEARSGQLPEEELTTKEWLSKYTKNKTVHGLFRNLCAVLFSLNPEDLPARTFLSFFSRSASAQFGFCPRGTIGVWEDLADGIRRKGGDIRLATRATRIITQGTEATGVVIEHAGETHTVSASTVISDTGVLGTTALIGETVLGRDYLDQVQRQIKPTVIYNYYLALPSSELEVAGLLTLANTDRLCTIGDLTATCPELAPPGWRLYVAYSVPPASGELDPAAEIEAALAELRREYPAFAAARVLLAERMIGTRTRAGYGMPQDTPIANVWNVGDSVITDGDGGTQACAVTGKLGAEQAIAYLSARHVV